MSAAPKHLQPIPARQRNTPLSFAGRAAAVLAPLLALLAPISAVHCGGIAIIDPVDAGSGGQGGSGGAAGVGSTGAAGGDGSCPGLFELLNGQCVCLGPYHGISPISGSCVWSCGQGTHPDNGSGQCVCNEGLSQIGVDEFGRRICG